MQSVLDFFVDADVDVVAVFQELADLNLQIRERGISVEALLRRAELQHRLGDYDAERLSTEEVLYLEPGHRQAWFRRALACIGLALVRAGKTPGPTLPTRPTRVPEHPVFWLDEAAYCLKRLLLDGDDEKARLVLAEVHDLVGEATP